MQIKSNKICNYNSKEEKMPEFSIFASLLFSRSFYCLSTDIEMGDWRGE